jgi:phage tail sheath protein FI
MAASSSTYRNRTTPGVYLNEIPAFGNAIVGVATAVPLFIGYTQCAGDPTTGASLYNKPVQISSMTEYLRYFGSSAPAVFAVSAVTGTDTGKDATKSSTAPAQVPSFYAGFTGTDGTVTSTGFLLQSTALPNQPNQFNLYWSMQAFFANGGGNCYIVSVGSYWTGQSPTPSSLPNPVPDSWILGQIALGDPAGGNAGLSVGLQAAQNTIGPTMIVIPEACQLSTADYGSLACSMLSQASTLQDRVAILDLPGCLTAKTFDELTSSQGTFSDAIAPQIQSASYGAAYAPALNSTIVSAADVLYTSLLDASGDNATVNNILTTQANALYGSNKGALATVQSAIATAFPTKQSGAGYSTDAGAYPSPTGNTSLATWQTTLDNLLLNALPVFNQIEQLVAASISTLPPSGIMAGIWTSSDNSRGVWNAPANLALFSVASPLYAMSDAEQSGFNVPLNGEAINIVRAQPGRGNVVWGARTLDGNSLDYRYIQVRRTLIYVEQSIKVALQQYVFAANDATTWSTVMASISGFLGGLWQAGGLMGSKPSEAFTVTCGLGSTMTAQDVLNGYMIVAVTLQMIHPAEFIELTFKQTMGS